MPLQPVSVHCFGQGRLCQAMCTSSLLPCRFKVDMLHHGAVTTCSIMMLYSYRQHLNDPTLLVYNAGEGSAEAAQAHWQHQQGLLQAGGKERRARTV